MVQWAMDLESHELFSAALEGSIAREGLLVDDLITTIARGCRRPGFEIQARWLEWYVGIKLEAVSTKTNVIHRLSIVVLQMNTLANLHDVLNRVGVHFDNTPMMDMFDAWAVRTFQERLSEQTTLHRDDASVLLKFLETCNGEWITKR